MKIVVGLLVLISVLLAGCGGGGSSGGGGSTNADPQGIWSMKNSSGGPAVNLAILENGETWGIFFTAGKVGGAYYGTTTVSGSNASTTLTEFDFGIRTLPPATISGAITPKSSLTLSGSSGSATFTYNSAYDNPAISTAIAGRWSIAGQNFSSGTIGPLSINVDSAGAFTVNETNCSIRGNIVPRPGGKSIYNVAVSFTGAGCGSDIALSGVGTVDTSVSPNQFTSIVANPAKTGGVFFSGVKQ